MTATTSPTPASLSRSACRGIDAIVANAASSYSTSSGILTVKFSGTHSTSAWFAYPPSDCDSITDAEARNAGPDGAHSPRCAVTQRCQTIQPVQHASVSRPDPLAAGRL